MTCAGKSFAVEREVQGVPGNLVAGEFFRLVEKAMTHLDRLSQAFPHRRMLSSPCYF